MTTATLTENRFLYLGSWRTVDCKPHRVPWIKYQAGLYAFVIDDEVVYVGKARGLHRRLRNYSRRAFRDQTRAPRVAHSSIADGMAYGVEIKVFVKVVPEADDLALLEAETALIRELHPIWNRTHLAKPIS